MPGPLELSILAVIVLLIFGSKRIRQLGQDAGEAIKGFRTGFKELEEAEPDLQELKADLADARETVKRLQN